MKVLGRLPLGCTRQPSALIEELFKIGSSGTLEQKYSASMGRRDAVRLVDIHGYTLAEVVRRGY